MDTELLVEAIDDGRRLVEQLDRDGSPVEAAFWARNEGGWRLYLVLPVADAGTLGAALGRVYASVGQIPGWGFGLSEIKVLSQESPAAQEVIALQRRFPDRFPIQTRRPRLGELDIEEAYIYPPTRAMKREEVLRAIAGLMHRSGTIPPANITLRDGTKMTGVPIGVRVPASGRVEIQLQEVGTTSPRTVEADAVARVE